MHGRQEASLRAEAARAAAAERRQQKRQQKRQQQEEAAYAATAGQRAAQQAEVDTHARLLQAQREECGQGLDFRALAGLGMLPCIPGTY